MKPQWRVIGYAYYCGTCEERRHSWLGDVQDQPCPVCEGPMLYIGVVEEAIFINDLFR